MMNNTDTEERYFSLNCIFFISLIHDVKYFEVILNVSICRCGGQETTLVSCAEVSISLTY